MTNQTAKSKTGRSKMLRPVISARTGFHFNFGSMMSLDKPAKAGQSGEFL
jgi:hypothetical protein